MTAPSEDVIEQWVSVRLRSERELIERWEVYPARPQENVPRRSAPLVLPAIRQLPSIRPPDDEEAARRFLGRSPYFEPTIAYNNENWILSPLGLRERDKIDRRKWLSQNRKRAIAWTAATWSRLSKNSFFLAIVTGATIVVTEQLLRRIGLGNHK